MSTRAEEQPLRHGGGQIAQCQPAQREKAVHCQEQSTARLLPGR